MASLRRELRKELEHAVTAARSAAEKGARKAIEALAVLSGKPWPSMSEDQKQLRSRLQAHGRQLGDRRELRSGNQSIDHIVQECAYEHWHRMLFARFLAENDLLIEPGSGVAISLDECRELALERSVDWLTLASEYAVKMLPQIFRAVDPVLEVSLPPETRQELEGLMKSLSREVFLADDSLGWVYQFWQAEKKDEVNASGNKIGADELAPVTQLFTEDYMVLFLLHNTLGAWWAGKVLAQQPDLAKTAKSEGELRAACAIGDVSWEYLRFVREGEGPWRPAAGTFDGWPQHTKDLRVLDPCMGSGHFLVFALPMLVALRMAEEKLAREDAIDAVLRDNLFGLELDNRCTQIAAFNLALTAWRIAGYRSLPPLNLACSGLGINAKEEEWVELAGKDQRLRGGMAELYELFKKGPVLGSLINPGAPNRPASLLVAGFHDLQPLLQAALRREEDQNYEAAEMAIAAQGMAKAGEILAGQFTLVATNVPYLGREGHTEEFMNFADGYAPDASADLSTLILHRCLQFTAQSGTIGVVLPQNWWVGKAYSGFRKRVLIETKWRFAAVLGEEAWQAFGNRGPNTILLVVEGKKAPDSRSFVALDVSTKPGTPVVGRETKALALAGRQDSAELQRLSKLIHVEQRQLYTNRDARISVAQIGSSAPLSASVISGEGCSTGDNDHFLRCFWELSTFSGWLQYCGPGFEHWTFCDNALVVLWEDGVGELARSDQARIQNTELWQRPGVLVGRVRGITATLFSGGCFSKGAVLVCPRDKSHYLPIYAFLRSKEFENLVRTIDPRVSAATSVLTDVPFDLAHWQKVAAEKYPHGLPKPFSSNPTQWLFNGQPQGSDQPLHLAVARLLGYQWPRQTGSSFPDCPALGADGLEKLADADGIVCLDALQGELTAAERIRALLAAAYGTEWSSGKQAELLAQVEATSLDQWLREKFFEQHCALFHNRPFIWHIWDGMKNGFHALVNYHKLAAPNGEGRRTLEKLIYSYLGDWTKQQRDDQKNGVEGADARVAAAEHLKKRLELILHGEPPYDIFVRWKSLHQQPIGWEPDINDGVRLNIRPFMTATPLNPRGKSACILRVTPKIKWEKDRGKEPSREKDDSPWFWSWDQSPNPDFPGGQKFDGNRWNDLHYSSKFKQSTRERNLILKKAQKR